MSWGDEYDGGPSAPSDPMAQLLWIAQDPLGVLARRWVWMLLCLVLGLLATGVFVATIQPTYVATARVLISSQQIPEDFVRSTVRESSLAHINEMVGQILSRSNLTRLVEMYDLYSDDREGASVDGVVDNMRSSIQIREAKAVRTSARDTSQVFGVSFTYREPLQTADIANELATLFVEASIERRNRQARYTTAFLRRELEESEREMRSINGEISEYQRSHRGELPGDLEPALQRLERLESQRSEVGLRISEHEDRILVLSGVKGGDAPPSELEAELSALRKRLAVERGVHTDEHPNVIALRDRVELMAQHAEGAPTSGGGPGDRALLIESEQREIQRQKEQRATIEREIAELESRLDRIPARAEQLKALEQRASVVRDNYLEFLSKVQDAELAETLESAQQGPRVSILDRARPPRSPERPPLLFLAAGIIASIGLAAASGLALELLDPVVLSTDQLGGMTGTPVLGSLPRLY